MEKALLLIALGMTVGLTGCAHAPAPINPESCDSRLEMTAAAISVQYPLGSGDILGRQLFSDGVDSSLRPMNLQTAGADGFDY